MFGLQSAPAEKIKRHPMTAKDDQALEKKIAILVISSDGSLDLLLCHDDLPDILTRREEILDTAVTEAMKMIRAVETDPLAIAVIEDSGPTMRLNHYRCIGCGKRLGNRRAKAGPAYCGKCRRKKQ